MTEAASARGCHGAETGQDPLRIPMISWRAKGIVLSALGGGALAGLGLVSRGWLGLGLLFAGGSLLVRGLTGHCTVNQAIGRNTAR